MKSPFPGMDPYIEARGLWKDFHHGLISGIKDAVAGALPERYFARTGERSYVELVGVDGKEAHHFEPDVNIATDSSPRPTASEKSTALAEPTSDAEELSLRPFLTEEFRETFLEIYKEDDTARLVTCIEVLSPSNKRKGSMGWKQYLRKRQGLLLGEANLVELDLLRGGTRLPMMDPWPDSPYTLLVSRAQRSPYCRVRKAYFHQPLPSISIPLEPPDTDIAVPLQPIVDRLYVQGRYGRSIRYTDPLEPPLTAVETAWLSERMKGTFGEAEKPKPAG